MECPLITVIVPVYKVEKFLKRCVESIVNQTYKNLEIILVDDGSPDNCGKMCEEFARNDSRIRVVHKENGGLSSARNAGINIMQGEYVGFVDSDDWIELDMYEKMHMLAKKHNADIVCCGIERISDAGHISYFNEEKNELLVFDKKQAMCELPQNYRITNSLCDKLYHRDIFKTVRMTEGIIYEDYDVMHKCIFQAECVVYTGSPYYKYFVNDCSITQGSDMKKQFDYVTAGKVRLSFYKENIEEALPSAMAKHIESSLDIIYRTRKSKECKPLKKQLAKELRTLLKEHKNLPFSSNTQRKVQFFKISTSCFIMFLNFYYILKSESK